MYTQSSKTPICFPRKFPQIMSGKRNKKISIKVVIKDDYTRDDGTQALGIQIILNRKKRVLPLGISVKPELFDKEKQRVRSKHKNVKDYNLLIEKTLADINSIEVRFHLLNQVLELDDLINEFKNPTASTDFIKFWELELVNQKTFLMPSSYRQQSSVLRKIKRYQEEILFSEITEDFVKKMCAHFKNKEKNGTNTISTLTKNFKKYLAIANKQGIWSPLHYNEVPHKRMHGTVNFLESSEIRVIHEYYSARFIKKSHKIVAAKFLFSCFTGLRISDIMALKKEYIIGGKMLVFTAKKTHKLQQIPLSTTAQRIVQDGYLFEPYSEKAIRELLKEIVSTVGIKKRVNYHMSRHSFATNFLNQGGNVQVLQQILGHSSIKETMIYVHVTSQNIDAQIMYLDNMIKPAE